MKKFSQLLLSGSLVLLVFSQIDMAYSQTSQYVPCDATMQNQELDIQASINKSKAISLAQNSADEFKSKIQNFSTPHISVAPSYAFNKTNCIVSLHDVTVEYDFYNSSGYIRSFVVNLDPQISKVLGTSEYHSWLGHNEILNNSSPVPEFPFAELVLITSIASLIIFHRIRIRDRIQ